MINGAVPRPLPPSRNRARIREVEHRLQILNNIHHSRRRNRPHQPKRRTRPENRLNQIVVGDRQIRPVTRSQKVFDLRQRVIRRGPDTLQPRHRRCNIGVRLLNDPIQEVLETQPRLLKRRRNAVERVLCFGNPVHQIQSGRGVYRLQNRVDEHFFRRQQSSGHLVLQMFDLRRGNPDLIGGVVVDREVAGKGVYLARHLGDADCRGDRHRSLRGIRDRRRQDAPVHHRVTARR